MDSRTTDTQFEVPPVEQILPGIFAKQESLVVRYKDIEKLPDYPIDINTAKAQILIKDFLWRIVEELCEGLELYPKKDDPDMGPLFYEEISDAIHFQVELGIFCGSDPKFVMYGISALTGCIKTVRDEPYLGMQGLWDYLDISGPMSFPETMMNWIYQLGLLGNTLKNKPWKQTQMMTDEGKFQAKMAWSFLEMFRMVHGLGLSPDDMYTLYMKKALVNQFRQETKY